MQRHEYRPGRLGALLAALLVAGAACSDDVTGPRPAPVTEETGRELVYENNVGVVEGQAGLPAIMQGMACNPPSTTSTPCSYDASTGWTTCSYTQRLRNGSFKITRRTRVMDADGNAQPRFDSLTRSTRTRVTLSGGEATDTLTYTSQRSSDGVVEGFGPWATTRTVTGAEQGDVVAIERFPGKPVTYVEHHFSYVTRQLVLPLPTPPDNGAAPAPVFPLSGQSVRSATITRRPEGGTASTLTVVEEYTFDGTPIVKIVRTINGVTRNCTRDVRTMKTVCA